MTQFEYFLAFFSLMLGLGVAQLLTGYGNLIRETPTPRLGVILPLVGAQLLLELISNFVYAWDKFDTIPVTLPGLILPTLIGVAYFLAATIATPANADEWKSLDDYFDQRQRWIVGLMLLANVLIEMIALQNPERTLGAGDEKNYLRLAFTLVWMFGSYSLLMFSRRRWLQIAAVISLMGFYLYIFGYLQLIEQG